MTPVPAIRESIATAPRLAMNGWRGSETTSGKNRINFLELLRGNRTDYLLSREALT